MDRFWMLTWTTYGTWLPGDDRGFVGETRDDIGEKQVHNMPGTSYHTPAPLLAEYAQSRLKTPPIYLTHDHAQAIVSQVHETAQHRGWLLLATAVMNNHVHLVVGVPGDPDPANLLRDFKSYASRRLNHDWDRPASGTWWTESGSRRKLSDDEAVEAAIHYVKRQHRPLVVWVRGEEE